MNTDELTQIATAHQSAISRHDQEMAEIRAILATTATQQHTNTQRTTEHEEWLAAQQEAIARHEEWLARQQEASDRIDAQQQANAEAIANLTASILDLRNLVADYIQNRENLDRERGDS